MEQRRGVQGPSKQAVTIRMLVQNNGLMFETLKRPGGGMIQLPGRINDRPKRDRRAQRFERFKAPV